MGITSQATLNGIRATDVRVNIPAWGCWYADVTIDGEKPLTGKVALQLADLALLGTILSGGPTIGRSVYRLVGGAGGWGTALASKPYYTDAGVKLATVLGDAAREAGETLAPIDPTNRIGVAFTREAAPASRVLHQLVPSAWYVREDGVTCLGARTAGVLPVKATRVQKVDLARGKVVLASDSIATILPGTVVDGLTAVDVMHEMNASAGLRSTVWGKQVGSSLDELRALIAQLDPDRDYRAIAEYRIDTRSGATLNLQPVRASSGMPYLSRVPVWPGIPGCLEVPPLGSRVLVAFIEADPARPVVTAFEAGSSNGGLTLITDGAGAPGHAVSLEQVLGLFAQYTAARSLVGDLGLGFTATYSSAPPVAIVGLISAMLTGAVTPAPIGPAPGGYLDLLGLPALITTALAAQLPDPASLGLPVPVMPGLAKKGFRL